MDSRRCIEFVWHAWAAERGLDPLPFIRVAHGRRISETLGEVAPHLDLAVEVARLDELESVETRGLAEVPGASALLEAIPPDSWAVVTSGSPPVARLRIAHARIPPPRLLITSAEVRKGKPDPEGYLLASARLRVSPADCVVVEDTPAGIAAGKAAGSRVIAVEGTYATQRLAAADYRIPALQSLRWQAWRDGRLSLKVAAS